MSLGTFGFSYVGLIFIVLLSVPNVIWSFHQPKDLIKVKENRVLLVFERIGMVTTSICLLVFSDTNFQGWDWRSAWLFAACALMLLYEIGWIRYFARGCATRDFYGPLLLIPIPLASLPVAAACLLGIYGRLIWLVIASLILGVGHLGIHIQYYQANLSRMDNPRSDDPKSR